MCHAQVTDSMARLEELTAQKEETTSELQAAASVAAAELESLQHAQATLQVVIGPTHSC